MDGPNGNAIFLPASGLRVDFGFYFAGDQGYYWSSSLYKANSKATLSLYFDSGKHGMYQYNRLYGFPVRPVRP